MARRVMGIVAAMVLLGGCGDGQNPFDATVSPPPEATLSATGPDTSAGVSTTATSAPTTTTATSSTSTTTSSTSTTTTTEPPPPMLFLPDGLGIVAFGSDPDGTIAIVQASLGIAPTADTGWVGSFDYGVCPGTTFRRVSFDGLDLEFADDGARDYL